MIGKKRRTRPFSHVNSLDRHSEGVTPEIRQKRAWHMELRQTNAYEIKPSLEMSLLPYVEKYRGSTHFFFASQLTTGAVLVGSWWPGGIGLYRIPRQWYDPTKHTSPNYRPWVMSPMYGLVRFYRRAICDARHHQSKNVPIQNMRESDLLEVILP